MHHVPFYDHAAEYRTIQSCLDEAFHRVLLSGRYERGDEVAAFEQEFAAFIGVDHAVTVGSCHDAMHRSLLALGMGPGDEILTVSNTDLACAVAITRTGASPVFVDIDERTYNIDPKRIEAAITARTRAILVVHMYGHPADMDPILTLARRHRLFVVEDVAVAVGATYKGQRLGTFGDVACFSHAPSKILGTYGDGGTVVTGDRRIVEAVRRMFIYDEMNQSSIDVGRIRIHGGFHHTREGVHGRMVELQAAALRVKLPHVLEWIARRREVAARYRERLGALDVVLPWEAENVSHVYRNFAVQVPKDRDAVRRRLAKLGVETGMHYTPPLHLQPVYRSLGYGPGSLPVTEDVARRIFTLPIYPQLTEPQIDWVAQAFGKALSPGTGPSVSR